ncbi:MAG: hypothetical protein WKF37_17110 [Bryobacteraceae bacterium]
MLRTLLLALAFSSYVLAQSTGTATIVGTVTDSSGALVPDSKVTARNLSAVCL